MKNKIAACVGIVGGSYEYTGAPYYAAYSCLKGGAAYAYIFCNREAEIPIKSYNSQITVNGVLASKDNNYMLDSVTSNFANINSLVIGPGLGRDQCLQKQLEEIFNFDISKVIDADGLYFLSLNTFLMESLKSKSNQFILTPNIVELKRLLSYFSINQTLNYPTLAPGVYELDPKLMVDAIATIKELSQAMNNVVILAKGKYDIITDGRVVFIVNEEGSQKRCGGQGDILSGLACLYSQISPSFIHACIKASMITRKAAHLAYKDKFYSLTTPDIMEYINVAREQLHDYEFPNFNGHKGSNGKIGIVGGSQNALYQPYYSAISSLKSGGELSYIYCPSVIGTQLKCLSPENIVYPILDFDEPDQSKLQSQLKLMNALIIGPGIDPNLNYKHQLKAILQINTLKVITENAQRQILSDVQLLQELQNNSKQAILLLNYEQLFKLSAQFHIDAKQQTDEQDECQYYAMRISQKLNGVILLVHGKDDIITDGSQFNMQRCPQHLPQSQIEEILAGIVAVYCNWSQNNYLQACLQACLILRSSQQTLKAQNLEVTQMNIINHIGQTYTEFYYNK